VIEEPLEGRLARCQAVFDRGRMVGFHACAQIEEGVGGGDLIKESIDAPVVRQHVERIGRHLAWSGGLSLDFISGSDGVPRYIDSNPRLAETGNGLAAGVNLPALLVDVSMGLAHEGCAIGRAGVRTYMTLQGLLRAAKESASRRRRRRAHAARTRSTFARARGLRRRGAARATTRMGPILVTHGKRVRGDAGGRALRPRPMLRRARQTPNA
jgi:predicted ATP-grasp superfamily ATP-dependent carboligase